MAPYALLSPNGVDICELDRASTEILVATTDGVGAEITGRLAKAVQPTRMLPGTSATRRDTCGSSAASGDLWEPCASAPGRRR